MGQPVNTCIVGNKSVEELIGSPNINVTSDGTKAVRTLRVAYADLWDVIDALTDKRQQLQTPDRERADFPGASSKGFQGSWANGQYFTKLQVSDIEVKPAWDGNQENITVDSTLQDLGKYDKYEMTVTYSLYTEPKRRATWSTRTNAIRQGGDWAFAEGDAETDPANPMKYLPSQEIMIPVYSYEWRDDIGDNASILNLSAANARVGSVNSDKITIYFGRNKLEFPAGVLLFDSFEVENVTKYMRAEHEIYYRLIVAPAYLYEPSLYTGTNPTNDGGAWNYEWSLKDGDFKHIQYSSDVSRKLFTSSAFANLFPWGAS